MKSEVEPIIEKETEKEPSEVKALTVSVADSLHLGEDEQRVLKALADGKFTLRTRTGVATQTGIKKEVVDKIVEELKAEGLANSVQILRKGQPRTRWYITPEGRSVLGNIGQ